MDEQDNQTNEQQDQQQDVRQDTRQDIRNGVCLSTCVFEHQGYQQHTQGEEQPYVPQANDGSDKQQMNVQGNHRNVLANDGGDKQQMNVLANDSGDMQANVGSDIKSSGSVKQAICYGLDADRGQVLLCSEGGTLSCDNWGGQSVTRPSVAVTSGVLKEVAGLGGEWYAKESCSDGLAPTLARLRQH